MSRDRRAAPTGAVVAGLASSWRAATAEARPTTGTPRAPGPTRPPGEPAAGWGRHVPAALAALALLLGLQLLGTLLVDLAHLPVPGAVVGLVVLLLVGARSRALVERVEPAGGPLLRHLQLLFVPPGVGALTQLSTIAREAGPLALAVVGSFAAGLLVAGLLLQRLLGRRAAA